MQQQNQDGRAGWKAAMLIAVVLVGVYLFASSRSTLWDRDEARFARSAVEMVESGNYLVPSFNGELWADKPILFYWLMSFAIRVFGPTEMACRFWGAVGSGLSCLLTYFIGRRLFGAKAGLWGMLTLGSSLMVVGTGTLGTIDAVLLPLTVSVLAVFVETARAGTHWWHVVLMGMAFGAGMLAKGPMGLLPVVAIAASMWLGRGAGLEWRRHTWGVACAVVIGSLIFLAWAIGANRATDGEFMRVFVGRHVLTRTFKPMEHHGGNLLLYLPYYLIVVVVGFLPWTLHLGGAVSAVLGGRVGGRWCRAFLIGWILPIVVLMTLAATKLPHYIAFIWPGLALAVGGTLVGAEQKSLAMRDWMWLRRGTWLFGPLMIAAALVLMIGPWFVSVAGLRWSGAVSGLALLVTAVVAVKCQLADRPVASAKLLLVGTAVFDFLFVIGVVGAVERTKVSPGIARAVNESVSKQTPLASYGHGEPTLNFYIGRYIEVLENEEAVVAWSRQQRAGALIIYRGDLEDIQHAFGGLHLEEVASRKGFNYSKGKNVELVALIRKPEI